MPASLGIRSLHYGSPVNTLASLNRGLVAWWLALPQRMGGGRWLDLLGGAHATLVGMGPSSATLGWGSTRRPGGAGELRLAGGTTAYLNVSPWSLVLTPTTTSYTWAFWLKALTFPEWQGVLAQLPAVADPNTQFTIYVHTTSNTTWGPVTAGVSVGFATGAGNFQGAHSGNNSVVAGAWSHWVLTWDGALLPANAWRLYRNAVDVTVAGTVAGTLTTIAATVFNLGRDTYGDPTLNGALDDVRIWRRALAPAEAQALYLSSQEGARRELNWLSWPPGWAGAGAAALTVSRPPRRSLARFIRRAA
jgi:Concanavalin A-like lectin/glucanases superfamily